jgi:hypothetical protein
MAVASGRHSFSMHPAGVPFFAGEVSVFGVGSVAATSTLNILKDDLQQNMSTTRLDTHMEHRTHLKSKAAACTAHSRVEPKAQGGRYRIRQLFPLRSL